MVVIIDYKVGNIASVRNMLKKVGCKDAIISSQSMDIEKATKLILPGVGSFDYGMQQLHKSGLVDSLNKRVLVDKVPILGICLGAQLLTKGSEEGVEPGLGWIDAKTVKFDANKLQKNLKIPNMGWTEVDIANAIPLFKDLPDASRFYFVHTYHMLADNPEDVAVKATYGYEFAAGLVKDNIMGMQFHPEKSHKYGMQLMRNFINNY
jgi:glutamine amidotransferase